MVNTLFKRLSEDMLKAKLTSPTARNLPLGLIATLVTALIRSRDVHVRAPLESAQSAAGDIPPLFPTLLATDLMRLSGVVGLAGWL
jgi:hypothetical protein